jgi:hypothetical protein
MPIAPTTKKVTHPFGENRGKRRHNGIDYDVVLGTPVKASADGVVVRSTMHEPRETTLTFRWNNNVRTEKKFTGSYGNVIIIYHGQGGKKPKHTYTLYAHLDHRSVRANEKVKEGQMIGTAGRSGTRQGFYNHKGGYTLHFEVLQSKEELTWLKTGSLDFRCVSETWRINPERFFRRSVDVVWIEVVGNFFDSKRQGHFSRNKHNIVDRSKIEDIINEKKGWDKKGFLSSRYHRQGSEKQLYHWKYVNKDGREAILDNERNLIIDSLNGGTYNFGKNCFTHIYRDWIPYVIWGNTTKDPTSSTQRLYGTYHTGD